MEDGTFIERATDISVFADVFLDALRLPKAVFCYDPTNVSANSATISWSATDAADFREYKLFRHTTSGQDETTGELVHVATEIQDTVFTDNLALRKIIL